MLKKLENNLILGIGDSTILAQVFVVILFFENYLLLFEETSLFKVNTEFDQIKLAPFIWFFIFIAISKLIWLIFYILLSHLKAFLNFFDAEWSLSGKVHFLAFLLVSLSTIYLVNINKNSCALAPFDADNHFWLFRLYQLPCYIVIILGGFIILFSNIIFEKDRKGIRV